MRKSRMTIIAAIFLVLMLALVTTTFGDSLPVPHNIRGRVFNADGVTGVNNGIPVTINETNSTDYKYTQVYSPPFEPGWYAATINGTDNDTIIVTAWNKTHYGRNTTTLISGTTYANIVLNTTRPSETNVTVILPYNDSIRNVSTYFNVTAIIAAIGGQNAAGCSAEIIFHGGILILAPDEAAIHYLTNINLGSSKTTTWNITGTAEGSVNITVNASCDSDSLNFEGLNRYTIKNITLEDRNNPVIELKNPINNSWINRANVTLVYNVSDPSNITNCSLYWNNRLNQTNPKLQKDILQNFTVNNTSEGNYSWFVSCYDNSSYLNTANSSVWSIKIDYTLPNATLISPADNTHTSNNTIIFTYNVSDYSGIDNCSLILNNLTYITNNTILINETQNFTVTITGDYYNWSISCIDKANNTGLSEIRSINITDPDLAAYNTSIIFSLDNPTEGQYVVIDATIFNIGNDNATNVTVQFFEDSVNGAQIGSNITINLTIGDSIVVNVTWGSKIGLYSIIVAVDSPVDANGSIIELNESNNLANRTIFISAYHMYYGDINANIILDSASNRSMLIWFDETGIVGNIFVIDSDSIVNWGNLTAAGLNTTGGNSSYSDYEEIDAALNLTTYIDSINSSYTNQGFAKQTDSFSVFGSNISQVPTINSTNSSNFITGILWDMSDENKGEYNSSQDLIFVTKINSNAQGKYGIYDYEIKVPSNLKRYIAPNNYDSLTFYTELK